jgi:hypothetical protein
MFIGNSHWKYSWLLINYLDRPLYVPLVAIPYLISKGQDISTIGTNIFSCRIAARRFHIAVHTSILPKSHMQASYMWFGVDLIIIFPTCRHAWSFLIRSRDISCPIMTPRKSRAAGLSYIVSSVVSFPLLISPLLADDSTVFCPQLLWLNITAVLGLDSLYVWGKTTNWSPARWHVLVHSSNLPNQVESTVTLALTQMGFVHIR